MWLELGVDWRVSSGEPAATLVMKHGSDSFVTNTHTPSHTHAESGCGAVNTEAGAWLTLCDS